MQEVYEANDKLREYLLATASYCDDLLKKRKTSLLDKNAVQSLIGRLQELRGICTRFELDAPRRQTLWPAIEEHPLRKMIDASEAAYSIEYVLQLSRQTQAYEERYFATIMNHQLERAELEDIMESSLTFHRKLIGTGQNQESPFRELSKRIVA